MYFEQNVKTGGCFKLKCNDIETVVVQFDRERKCFCSAGIKDLVPLFLNRYCKATDDHYLLLFAHTSNGNDKIDEK